MDSEAIRALNERIDNLQSELNALKIATANAKIRADEAHTLASTAESKAYGASVNVGSLDARLLRIENNGLGQNVREIKATTQWQNYRIRKLEKENNQD